MTSRSDILDVIHFGLVKDNDLTINGFDHRQIPERLYKAAAQYRNTFFPINVPPGILEIDSGRLFNYVINITCYDSLCG